jgi:hypothetical protein
MGRLFGDTTTTQGTTASNFNYTAVGLKKLAVLNDRFCLVTINADETGSVDRFKYLMDGALKDIIRGLKKSDEADMMLIRLNYFGSQYDRSQNVSEIHGFTPLNDIDENQYQPLDPSGMTPLYDVSVAAIDTTMDFAATLSGPTTGFLVNGIQITITDGGDNVSRCTPVMVANAVSNARQSEHLESNLSILVGVNDNDPTLKKELEKFKDEAKLDRYISAGDVTPESIAKLVDFVVKSVSSQSQSIGSGGPSQTISTSLT